MIHIRDTRVAGYYAVCGLGDIDPGSLSFRKPNLPATCPRCIADFVPNPYIHRRSF